MIISTIIDKGEQKDNIIILKSSESKVILEAMEFYCEKNKRKQKAKTLLKKMHQDLECF